MSTNPINQTETVTDAAPPGVPTSARIKAGSRSRRALLGWTAFLLAAFAYRLGFGLCSEFFSDDETQIFLIGLRHYAGAWPFFGADVVWTRSQIPGALQGLLVGLPMRVVAAPEAPFVLLNLLSMAALVGLAWYIRQRLPSLPRWLVYGWLLFIPWTLNYGTHLLNPDYVLCGAVVFFVGYFEADRRLRLGVLHVPVALAAMGAAVGWVMQLHMSWPLLGPFVLIALWQQRRDGLSRLVMGVAAFAAGAALTGALLLPTFWNYGLFAGGGGTHRNLTVHVEPPWTLLSTLARMLSFPSIEVGRFLGIDTNHRLQLLADHLWVVPFFAVAWIAGLAQPLWLAVSWFRRIPTRQADWPRVRALLAGSVLLVYISYSFVIEPPQAHAFYVLAPIAFIYGFYCWTQVDSRRARGVAAVVLLSSVVYHAGVVVARAPERSLYKNRQVAAAAVAFKNAEVLGHRRAFAMEGAPHQDVFASGDEVRALRAVSSSWATGVRGVVVWTITVRNDSATNAYRDLAYDATYRDAQGRSIEVFHDVLPEILQPGQSVTVSGVTHGYRGPVASADFRVVRAQRLLPLSALGR
ncbi:MAG: hypothetical protein ACM3NQ_17805 [Bacteroidales bacterium]